MISLEKLHFFSIICRASFTGIFVNKDTTSKLTNKSVGSNCMVLKISRKCFEFFTYDAALSVYGCKILARNLANSCVGHPIELTIGLRGTPCLCTFGKPYSLGHFDDFSLGIKRCWSCLFIDDDFIFSLVIFSK